MGVAGNTDIFSDGVDLYWRDPQLVGGGCTRIITEANSQVISSVNTPPASLNSTDFRLQPIFSEFRDITVPNPYDGLQANAPVHPSLVFVPEGWNGYKYWLAFTPYPAYSNVYENPSVVASNDLLVWSAPKANPLVAKPAAGYNSDVHLFFAPDKSRLYLAFRERTTDNAIKIMHTTDGINWSAPVSTITGVVGTSDYASPSIWWNGTNWVMISHQLDAAAPWPVRRNVSLTANIYDGWAAATTVTFAPFASRAWWHSFHVRMPSGQIVALFQDNDQVAGNAGFLYLAESSDDGVTYTLVGTLGPSPGKYRSTFAVRAEAEGPVIDFLVSDYSALKLSYWKGKSGIKAEKAAILANHYSALRSPTNLPAKGIWADTFTRADNAASVGTADSGGAYTVNSGTWGILTNRAYPVASGRLLASAGTANHVVSCQLQDITVGGQQWIIARAVDGLNYWRLGVTSIISPAPSLIQLQSIIAGSISGVNKTIGVFYKGSVLTLEAVGALLRVYVDGLLIHEELCTVHMAGTQFGLQANSGANTFYRNLTCFSSL